VDTGGTTVFCVLYNEPKIAQLIENYYTARTCFDTIVASSGKSSVPC
jgi:hypothetical protein